jgi:hypothetical protein
MTSRSLPRFLLLAVLTVLIAAGCTGGDAGDGDGAASSTTAAAVTTSDDGESVSVFDLEEGMCIDSLEGAEDSVSELDVVDCDTSHEAEVFSVFEIEGEDDFPGADQVEGWASSGCEARFEDYVGLPFQQSRFQATFLAPSEDTWGDGDREVVCLAFSGTGELSESVEDANE